MPGISRVNKDTAGGIIIGELVSSVLINNFPIVVKGANIISHGSGPHASSIMIDSSNTVFAEDKAICRSGDLASCGHSATGSNNVEAN